MLIYSSQNIVEGLTVRSTSIAKNVSEEMPFLALEKALMYLCQEGVDRQKVRHIYQNGYRMGKVYDVIH